MLIIIMHKAILCQLIKMDHLCKWVSLYKIRNMKKGAHRVKIENNKKIL
jgi:hypothetical protein